ncbi:hypothetical protein LEMLEM_LOCUS7314 [Lemmus lemmus]
MCKDLILRAGGGCCQVRQPLWTDPSALHLVPSGNHPWKSSTVSKAKPLQKDMSQQRK